MIKWIPIKISAPDKYRRVLVTNGKQICLHYKQSNFNDLIVPVGDLKDTDGKWCECCNMEPEDEITHWAYIDEITLPKS